MSGQGLRGQSATECCDTGGSSGAGGLEQGLRSQGGRNQGLSVSRRKEAAGRGGLRSENGVTEGSGP